MSHHHRRSFEENAPPQTAPIENPSLPMFEKNDIALLAMFKPVFSVNGQKAIDLLINTNGNDTKNSIPDLSGILSQLTSKGENNKINDMLPLLLNLLSNPEIKNILTPTLMTTFMSMMANKKEPTANEGEST